jgi:hypothetical protein
MTTRPDPNDRLRNEVEDAVREDIDGARPYEPNGGAEPPDFDSAPFEPSPNIPPRVPWTVPLMKWCDPTTIPRRQFIYGFFYARGVLSATIADGGVGKSLLKLVELLSMITGRPLLEITPHERVRALYWNGDDPYVEVERRIHAICKHYEIDLKELLEQGWLSIGTSDEQPLCLGEVNRGNLILNKNAIRATRQACPWGLERHTRRDCRKVEQRNKCCPH